MKIHMYLRVAAVVVAIAVLPACSSSSDGPSTKPLNEKQKMSADVVLHAADFAGKWDASPDGPFPSDPSPTPLDAGTSELERCLGIVGYDPSNTSVLGQNFTDPKMGPTIDGKNLAVVVSSAAGYYEGDVLPQTQFEVTATAAGRACYLKATEAGALESLKAQYGNIASVTNTNAALEGLDLGGKGYAFRTTATVTLSDGKTFNEYYDSVGIYNGRAYATFNATSEFLPTPLEMERPLVAKLTERLAVLAGRV